ncbi:MAG: HAD-IA family hydrolase, partial [Myxococcota bacterium]
TPHFKPHPEPYLLAAERLGVDPGRCVVVEDSERGLQAAVAAGMSCVAIPNQMTRVGDFSRADRVITSLRELPAIVAACGP